jgi:multiple sugar transport system substrate-binding protein
MRRFPVVMGVIVVWSLWLAGCGPTPTVGTPTAVPSKAQTVTIHWFAGLGTGSDPNQQNAEQAAVDDFNQTVGEENSIELVLEVVPSNTAKTELADRIAAGNGPDIVGPVAWPDANAFNEEWLDIEPYMDAAGFDTSVFTAKLMDLYRTDNGLVSLPFVVSPSVVFYNKTLFNRRGLAYPPHQYGVKYSLPDGTEADWSWDTLATVAQLLTVDGAGSDASQLEFNRDDVRQYGFTWQNANHPNYWGSYWAGGTMLGSDGKTAKTPDAWKDAWRWTYDAIWGSQPFLGRASVEGSADYWNGKPFNSNKVAMTVVPFRNAYNPNGLDWDIGVLPSYQGGISGRMEEEAFRVWKGTRHPQETFTVMQYLTTTAAKALILGSGTGPAAFDGVPALISAQGDWRTAEAKLYPGVFNLDVVIGNLEYPALPPVDGYTPNFQEAWSRGFDFANRLRTTPGLDLDVEIKSYEDALTAIFAKPASP